MSILRFLSIFCVAAILALTGCGGGEKDKKDGPAKDKASDGGKKGAIGPVKVIAFDENEMVLQGIKDGTVVGTVVQNPYMYGYKSIEVLNELHKGNKSVLPADKFINVPARVVLKDASKGEIGGAKVVAVGEFWDDLKKKVKPDGAAPAPAGEGKPSYAYVTNGVADFWTIAKAGADKAGGDLGVNVTTIMPAGITDQTRKIEDLLTRGTNGIALSPINPENQGEAINAAAAKTNLITHDSDAPASNRLVYIGMDNYQAGYICGSLVRDALPNGGKVMIFIGRLDQDNAKRRRQGCIDGILQRKMDATRSDPPGNEIKSDDGKFVILGTLTDNFDRAKAKANAEDTLTRHPDIAAMVGLFEYNPPLIMEALDRAGRLGK